MFNYVIFFKKIKRLKIRHKTCYHKHSKSAFLGCLTQLLHTLTHQIKKNQKTKKAAHMQTLLSATEGNSSVQSVEQVQSACTNNIYFFHRH